MSQKSFNSEKNALYLVPTPIGNLDDMTYRAIDTLKNCDVVVCEDTRITGQLLKHYNLSKQMICSNDHNEDKVKEKIERYLSDNKSIALVTDRGTPIISDPGYKIVSYIIKKGYNVIGLPGSTAFVPALITSAIDPQPFTFYGFLNSKISKRKRELENLKYHKYTLIFYESPHRVCATLELMLEILGDRKISVAREISKLYEEIYRGTISEVITELQDINIKGEFVIVLEGNKEKEDYSNISIDEHIDIYLEDGLSEKEAIKKVALDRNMKKADIYNYYQARK